MCGTFLLSAGLTRLMLNYAPQFGLLDAPNHRSSHTLPTPKGGGLAVAISFYVALFFLYTLNDIPADLFALLLLGSLAIALLGLQDDRKHIPSMLRFLIQIVVAIGSLWAIHGLAHIDLGFVTWHGYLLGFSVALYGIVWMINLYNFMDGIDGLAASEALSVAANALVLLYFFAPMTSFTPILLVLMGAVGGFLIFNWSPAKIFMGDIGSSFLGYLFALIAILSIKTGVLSLTQWLILLSGFWFDATFTLIRRMAQREKWWQAHCTHAFQTMAKKLGAHRPVVLRTLLINTFWLLPLALLCHLRPHHQWLWLSLAIAPWLIRNLKNYNAYPAPHTRAL